MPAPSTTDQLGIRPAHLHIVAPELAARVAVPAYDMLHAADRSRRAADPLNYIHVLRADRGDIDRRRNRRALQRLLRSDVFEGGSQPRFAWYRLTAPDGHVQTGLIVKVAIGDYDAGRIVRHEHTRADREERLADYQRAVAADGSPVALAYRAEGDVRALAREATSAAPHLCFTADDGVEHALWITAAPAQVTEIRDALAGIDRLYVTDGHHRLAAASRVAAASRAAGADVEAPDQWVLAALFAHDELRILPFHRAVTRPHGVPARQLLADVSASVAVAPLAGPTELTGRHTFCMWLDDAWYLLTADPEAVGSGPLEQLDVTVLQRQVLGPVLGVHEPRLDPRLTYVAGDAAAVAAHCVGASAIGFMVRPTSMLDVMQVADAETVMPPKSTLFSPKTCAGVVLRLSS